MSVLRTAWNARWVYVIALVSTLAWGLAGAAVTAWMATFVLGPYGGEVDAQHAFARLAEMVTQNPELAVGIASAAGLSAALAWLGWTVLGGIVFFSLRGDALPDAARGGLRVAGPLLAQGLMHAALAGLGLFVLSIVLGPLPVLPRVLALLAGASIAILARDLVRAQLCLHPVAKPYHPRLTFRGFLYAVKNPKGVAITAGLWGLKMALAVSLAPIAFAAVGPTEAAGVVRLLAAIGLALGMLRLAWVVAWVPVDLEPAPTPADADTSTAAESAHAADG